MREYTFAAALALCAALVAVLLGGGWRDRALWLGLLAFATLTVCFDVVMTQVGLFGYAGANRSGIGIGRMPLEDLAYGLALYLLAVTVWNWGDRRGP